MNTTALVDGKAFDLPENATGFTLFSDKKIVAMRVNGELKDLAASVLAGDVVEGIHISSNDGLNILRHSTAHVLAQAVQTLNPEAKLGIGPPIKDGFYYDFDVLESFTPEDLKELEKLMSKIISSGQRFVRRVTNEADAVFELENEPYKLELIGLKSGKDIGEASAEVGSGELTIYDNFDTKENKVVWRDLCRGPHLPNTRMIGNGFALTRVAAAYWRGNENNKQLQRIYGTAWPSKDELLAHQE
ncbi:MAG: threonine--tRNA ligase, partial [Actinomycetota bacterium]